MSFNYGPLHRPKVFLSSINTALSLSKCPQPAKSVWVMYTHQFNYEKPSQAARVLKMFGTMRTALKALKDVEVVELLGRDDSG